MIRLSARISLAAIFICLFPGFNAETSAQDATMYFRNVGPSRGGRVTAVCGVEKQPAVFYMGSTGGGVWKTEDYGSSWNNISDGSFASPSIGAIAVYQENPDIIYVGTGSDAIRSNVIAGRGMYKTSDAGKHWEHIGLIDGGQIGAVQIHPGNPDVVFAAVIGQAFRKSPTRGVYRSTNGGREWEQLLFLSDSVGAVDLELAPDNPDIIYASMWRAERKPWTIISGGASDGIYRSVDGGDSWEKMQKGLPDALVGKIDFAVSPAMPQRVWAQIEAADGQGGIYRSDDYGENWTKAAVPENILSAIMQRPFYFTNISVNPLDANHIWTGAVRLYSSRDGGLSWKRQPVTHSDHHDLWIHPSDSLLMIEGNDGGASVSRDGGRTWSTQYNQPTAELYSCNIDDGFPYRLYSGQQDNSSISVPSRPYGTAVFVPGPYRGRDDIRNWEAAGGCETGPVLPKPGNPGVVYANCKGRFSIYYRDTRSSSYFPVGGEEIYGTHPEDVSYRFQRVTPMEVSPFDPETVYYGSQYLHRTSDGGKNWERISPDLTAYREEFRMRSGGPITEDITGEENHATLYAIRESPLQRGLLWTGSNDGLVHVSKDGGGQWEEVTPPMPPNGRVSHLEVSPHHPARAYVAINRDYLGDERPWFFKTQDFGKTWTHLSGRGSGIPADFPARVLREDPVREGLLFAGTEFGLFISFDDGLSWQEFRRGLPLTPVSDLRIAGNDLALSTMGRSFWIMDDMSALREYEPGPVSDLVLFSPPDVYNTMQKICFRLPDQCEDQLLSLSLFRGDRMIYSISDSISALQPDEFGICALTWDQHIYFRRNEELIRGPRVSPGEIEVRIELGEQSRSAVFSTMIHPLQAERGLQPEELREQEEYALSCLMLKLEIQDRLSELEAEYEKIVLKGKKRKLDEEIRELSKGPGTYEPPGLLQQVNTLYRILSHSPQALGEDSRKRLHELELAWEDFNSR